MIENVSHFILGMIFGFQIDICDINKQWEVKRDRDRNRLDRIEDRIGKLASDFNDIIRKKV